MASIENTKSSTQSTLRDASSESMSSDSATGNRMDSVQDTASRFMSEASPRVREAFDQFSGVAGDVYNRAQTWLGQGNNKNYGMIALVATAGILGFALGRSLGSDRSSEA